MAVPPQLLMAAAQMLKNRKSPKNQIKEALAPATDVLKNDIAPLVGMGADAGMMYNLRAEDPSMRTGIATGAIGSAAKGFQANGISGLITGGIMGGLTGAIATGNAKEQKAEADKYTYLNQMYSSVVGADTNLQSALMYAEDGGEIVSADGETFVPIQTEAKKIGKKLVKEKFIFSDGKIADVNATKPHSEQKKDDVTDIVVEGAYVMPVSTKLNKKDLDSLVSYSTSNYSENGKNFAVEKVTLRDILGEKFEGSFAEATDIITKKYPVMDTEDDLDPIARITNNENIANRSKIIAHLMRLNEAKINKEPIEEVKLTPSMKAKTGGYIRKYVLVSTVASDPPGKKRKPIYVDPKDPRLKKYQDSLELRNMSEELSDMIGPKSYFEFQKGTGSQYRESSMVVDMPNQEAYALRNKMYKKSKSTGILPIGNNVVDVDYTSNLYKKPIQPYIGVKQRPKVNIDQLPTIQSEGIDMPTRDLPDLQATHSDYQEGEMVRDYPGVPNVKIIQKKRKSDGQMVTVGYENAEGERITGNQTLTRKFQYPKKMKTGGYVQKYVLGSKVSGDPTKPKTALEKRKEKYDANKPKHVNQYSIRAYEPDSKAKKIYKTLVAPVSAMDNRPDTSYEDPSGLDVALGVLNPFAWVDGAATVLKSTKDIVTGEGQGNDYATVGVSAAGAALGLRGSGAKRVGDKISKFMNNMYNPVPSNIIGKKQVVDISDFNKENEYYRVVVGDDAFNDIVQTGTVRTKPPVDKVTNKEGLINLDRRGTTAYPSFSKGKASIEYAKDNPNNYIVVTADESIKPSTSGRHGVGTTMFPTSSEGKHLKELAADKVKVYKHMGNGKYELVDHMPTTPKMSKGGFVSKYVLKPAMSLMKGGYIRKMAAGGGVSDPPGKKYKSAKGTIIVGDDGKYYFGKQDGSYIEANPQTVDMFTKQLASSKNPSGGENPWLLVEGTKGKPVLSANPKDDEWISQILDFETTTGSRSGTGLKDYGIQKDKWGKKYSYLNKENLSKEDAVRFIREEYISKVKDYPPDVQKRLVDYAYNTGRNIEDVLMHASGLVDTESVQTKNTDYALFDKNKEQIIKNMQDPNFVSKIDQSKHEILKDYWNRKGTPQVYDDTSAKRINMWTPNQRTKVNIGKLPNSYLDPIKSMETMDILGTPVMRSNVQVPISTTNPTIDVKWGGDYLVQKANNWEQATPADGYADYVKSRTGQSNETMKTGGAKEVGTTEPVLSANPAPQQPRPEVTVANDLDPSLRDANPIYSQEPIDILGNAFNPSGALVPRKRLNIPALPNRTNPVLRSMNTPEISSLMPTDVNSITDQMMTPSETEPIDQFRDVITERKGDAVRDAEEAKTGYKALSKRVGMRDLMQLGTGLVGIGLQDRTERRAFKRPLYIDQKYRGLSPQQINQQAEASTGAGVEAIKQMMNGGGDRVTARLAPVLIDRLMSQQGQTRKGYMDQNQALERSKYAERGTIQQFNLDEEARAQNTERDFNNKAISSSAQLINKYISSRSAGDIEGYKTEEGINRDLTDKLYKLDNQGMEVDMIDKEYEMQMSDVRQKIAEMEAELMNPNITFDEAARKSKEWYIARGKEDLKNLEERQKKSKIRQNINGQ